jgi:hypothetical protein
VETRSGRRKSISEQVLAEFPAIIERCIFEQVQGQLRSRNPHRRPQGRVLVQAALANGGSVPGVRSFVRKWRPVGRYRFPANSTT